MQITSRLALPFFACVILGGCAGVSPTRIIGNTVGVAGGALLGSSLGKRNPLATAAGAGAGLLLSESLQAGSLSPQASPTLRDMKKDVAIPPSSNTTRSSSSSGSQPVAAMSQPLSSTFRCPIGKPAGPSSNPARALCAFRNNAMKALIATLIAATLSTAAHAQYVVTNPISDVLDEIIHVEDIAKTVEMINNQVQQINALDPFHAFRLTLRTQGRTQGARPDS